MLRSGLHKQTRENTMKTKRDFYKLAAAEDHNRVEFCRTCNSKQMGRVWHAPDAMGLPSEVLWGCFRCQNPPALVGFWARKACTGVLVSDYPRRAPEAPHTARAMARARECSAHSTWR